MAKKLSKAAKITLITILVVVVGIGAGFGIFAIWASNTDVLSGSGIKIIAHRGFSGEYTENSLTAFRKASEKKEFYGIETDVHVTSDGVLICNHDEEVHFKDGTDLVIAENTLETLQSKYIKSEFDENERVALFEDYLAVCAESGKRAIIEIKAPLTVDQIQKILVAVDNSVGRDNITIISFHFDQLEIVKSLDDSVEMMYLVMNPFLIPKALENNYSIGCFYLFVTAPMVADFHEKGLEVNAWTCNDNVAFALMKNAGADYITTNVLPVI